MMLNFAAYVFAMLAYYAVGYAFQFGAVAINAAPTNLGGIPTLNKFLLGSGQWGFVGGKGFFLTGPAYDAASNVFFLFEVVFMETAGYISVDKQFVGRRPQTTCCLTAKGREAFTRYLDHLEAIVRQGRTPPRPGA